MSSKQSKIWYSVGIVLGIVIVLNMIVGNIQARFDVTKNDVYTMSDVTKNILDQVDEPILVKVFYSDKFPTQLLTIKDYVFDLLNEYKAYAGSRLDYEFVEIGENTTDEKTDAEALGVRAVRADIRENDQLKVQLIYFGIAFLFNDKKEVIPFVQNAGQLEYEFTGALKRLIEGGKPQIAYLTGFGEPNMDPPNPYLPNANEKKREHEKMFSELRDQYDLQKVDLKTATSIPQNIPVAIWVSPTEVINEKAKFLIDQYLMNGGRLAVFVNNQKVNFASPVPIIPQTIGIRDFLKNYGVQINDNIVIDKQAGSVSVPQKIGNLTVMAQMEYPFIPILTNFNKEQPIVSRMTQMSMSFPSSIDSVAKEGIQIIPLVQTSDKSGYAIKDQSRNMYNASPQQFFNFNQKGIILAVVSQGHFKSAFSAKPDTVDYPKKFVGESNSDNGRLVAVGDADFLKDDLASKPNLSFLLNTIDWLIDENGLISIRSKDIEIKPLDKDILEEKAAGSRNFIKLMNVLLAPIILIVFGLVKWFIRRKTKKLASVR